MRFLEAYPVLALTSDASVDFTPVDFDAPLNDAQAQYLRRHTGRDIAHVAWRRQVHGHDVLSVGGGGLKGCPDADAFVTDKSNVAIAIRTADCVPVFFYDPIRHAAGLAHAGWKGTKAGIAAKTVKIMQDKYGCRCYDLKVVLGPAIRSCCYAVGEEFAGYFPQDTVRRAGRLYADMIASNRRQLEEAGVRDVNIMDSGICTCCAKGYFSFRRDGEKAGRMISLIMLKGK